MSIAALSETAADASRASTGPVVQTLFDQVIDRMESAHADRTTPVAYYAPAPTAGPSTTASAAGTASIGSGPAADTAQVLVTAGYAVSGGSVPGLETYSLPAAEVASIVHHGPMNTISTAYQALAQWAEATGHTLESPRWREHYLEADGEDQSTWIVELQLELS